MRREWHVGRWGALGWSETVVKLAAMLVAMGALAGAREGAGGVGWGRILAVVALALATLGLVAAIVDRLVEREVIAVVFVVLNVAAHIAIVLVAAGLPATRGPVIAFAALMAVGDAIKIAFLRRERFRVRGVDTPALVALTGAYIGLSLLAIIGALVA